LKRFEINTLYTFTFKYIHSYIFIYYHSMDHSLTDYHLFLTLYPTRLSLSQASTLLFFEIHLLTYRTRLYQHINLHIVTFLLPFTNINHIIQPLYLHKPTLFFHAIYTTHIPLINLFIKHYPTHYINQSYSLLTALHTKHLPTIKALIPYTHIHFEINHTTPYHYAIEHFKPSHPIHILFLYLHLHLPSIKLLIHFTHLPIDTIKHIQTFFI
jgi:hypothetical protein